MDSSILQRPPGPPPRRWYAPHRAVLNLSGLLRDPLGYVTRRFDAFGSTYHVDEGNGGHLYVTRDPALIRSVLVDNAPMWKKRGGANDRLVPILGDGLLTADGDTWKDGRRRLQPAFRPGAIQAYADSMVELSTAMPWVDNVPTDVSADMTKLTLDIVCRALFNVTIDLDAVGSTMEALHEATSSPPLPAWMPSPWRSRERRAITGINELLGAMITQRRAEGIDGPDVLSALLRADFPDQQVRDHLVTLFLAGHETTSHALAWTWWLLSQHPEIEARLHAEVDALPGLPTYASELPYTEAVANEALRLFPPAYALPRVAAVDTMLGPFDAPAGTQVVCWVWHAHRDPEHFPEPEAFRPERFVGGKTPPAFLPFGAGTRMCIGAGFARLELKLVLATLARRWSLSAVPGQQVRPLPRVTLAPAGGMRLTPHARAS